ncbi:peptidylprolyl isomerase [Lutimaribacter sp. EGI FJ00015]|uniref:Peptidylprolyl isomerase n=1 Tax=Lutimaribacter degradans TaxID=2945989 RepID=A0ACC5ZSA7_9RHOB|nr:peptidylprolyl isomerase [Lutimaribacter sp. EGI FJ00013]MCM2561214.1 peptidylprolyl isomerase [Lutimaribacter sp. EGI FJ00013]MCO0611837.1 peptidylprolyl isomerase [Lutimaribacter sp. EGI FJ00015]MCO0635042.1 peptidylprolyl isomerase [Lutimaribacter sp. EGI FJ00014]
MKRQFSRIAIALIAAATLLAGAVPGQAQNPFAPVITVNDKVITGHEIEQRALMLRLFRAPGDPQALAREQLIEERLKLEAIEQAGLELSDEGLKEGMEEFSSRADMTPDQFLRALEAGGVAEQTYREFVRMGVLWRELVRARFAGRVQISETEVDRALATLTGGSSVRVLLSEIIIPAPPEEMEAVMQRAERISEITSFDAFSAEARRSSASPTRDRGGRMPWMALTELPAQLRPIVLGLAPGQVSDPLPIENAVALFQLRALEETDVQTPEYAAIEYAAYYIDGGRSEATLARAERIRQQVDTCDDLYGIAQGQPPEVLERGSKKPEEIPQDIAVELAKLDPGEVSTTLTRAGGQTLVFLMMCGRTPVMAEDQDRDALRNQLRAQRLQSYAEGYLEQLRADARISER